MRERRAGNRPARTDQTAATTLKPGGKESWTLKLVDAAGPSLVTVSV
jgi:hypothetical protein